MQVNIPGAPQVIIQAAATEVVTEAAFTGFTKHESEVVALNVGGTHHLMTERDVLCLVPGSLLHKQFSGILEPRKVGDEVFLDRDGKTFLLMVNYLRNNMIVLPDF